MHSHKIRLLSLNMILVMLLTLLPVQAVEDTGTDPDEEKTEYTVTLNGSGGTLNGAEEMVVTYSTKESLKLRDYPFTREGYVLVGWSEDATGTTGMYDCEDFLSWQIGSGVLYAVWLEVPESGSYAIFDTCGWGELPDAFSRAGNLCCVELTDDFTMPVLQKNSTESEASLWLWHAARNWDAIYYEGEAFVPKSGMQFRIEPVSGGNGYHRVILDGNGGAETFYDKNGAFTANKHGFQNFSDGTALYTPQFRRPGYTLTGYNTRADGMGTAYPADNFIITSDMAPVQILYAQWSPLDLLKDGVRLIIDGKDMTGLLGKDGWSDGAGWQFIDEGQIGTAHGRIAIRDSRYGGGSIAFDGDLTLDCYGGASVGRIEAAGSLELSARRGEMLSVKASGVPALRAKSVSVYSSNVPCDIEAENAVAVDAARLWLNSPNVTIKGDPAVREGAVIDCEGGIGYTISEDRTTLTTYAIEQKITLKGNGGTFNGEEEMVVTYSAANPLDLRDYPFAWEGHVLLGWSEDATGTTRMYDCGTSLSWQIDSGVLYAVWLEVPESGSYAIFDTNGWGELPDAFSHAGNLCCVELTDDFTMPVLQKNSTELEMSLWLWHSASIWSAIYYEGEAFVPKSGMQFCMRPVWDWDGYHQVIFDGNGGTETLYDENGAFTANKHDGGTPSDGEMCGTPTFRRPGYILMGYNTQADGTGTAYPAGNIRITSDMTPVQILYAQWSPLDLLKDGVRLIIDGDDMTELLDKDGWSNGDGWEFIDEGRNGTARGQIEIRDSRRYSGGSIAFDGDLMLICYDGASVDRIEAAGSLDLSAWDDGVLSVKASGVPALRATSVSVYSSNVPCDIEAENAVAVDAARLWLNSPNVTIKGDPAVREGAVIDCEGGIGYTISEDRTTLTTYAIEQKITLKGNGGTFNGEEEMVVTYSAANPLNLRDYPFAREGYALLGWSGDATDTTGMYDCNTSLSWQIGSGVLYAVWLEVPESGSYAIFDTRGWGEFPNAFSHAGNLWCVELTDDFKMPVLQKNSTAPEASLWLWRSASSWNAIYYEGEAFVPKSGMKFRMEPVSGGNGYHQVIFDGNGGTETLYDENGAFTANKCYFGIISDGEMRDAPRFYRPGYILTGFNTKQDGTGTAYPADNIRITSDMAPVQILYAQWEETTPSGKHITIDGKTYDAMRECRGEGWQYDYRADSGAGTLSLRNYHGGGIVSDLSLTVSVTGTNTVTGGIDSKETLKVRVPWYQINNELTLGSLHVHASEGYALHAGGLMLLQVMGGELNITGGENSPALYAQELNISCWENGSFEATGSPNALSYGEIIKDRYQTYLIRGGKDKESAAPITDDTYNNRAYISYEIRDRVLTLHGNGGKTAAGADTFTATSKADAFDLGACMNTFTNGDKRLLGWSKTENSATIDYAAASGTMYYFDWSYEFAADLYAVWESGGQTGVVLKDYGYYRDDIRYIYSERYTMPVSGSTFVLPESYKAGYVFTGWLGSDGETYAAGAEIKIPTSVEFTAQYTTGTFEIDGKTYSMERPHGSEGIGWEYAPGTDRVPGWTEIRIYRNYSGKPINISGNVRLWLDGTITGTAGCPAISVDGNVEIFPNSIGHSSDDELCAQVYGGAGAPAVRASGTIRFNENYGHAQTFVFRGDSEQPAFAAQRVRFFEPLLAGESEADADYVASYQDQSYVCAKSPITIGAKEGDVLPARPDTELGMFAGWQTENPMMDCPYIQYRPGDTYTGSGELLRAYYVPSYCETIVLAGNGGVTEANSRYRAYIASGTDLQVTADELTNAFRKDGYRIDAYSTDAAGKENRTSVQALAERLTGVPITSGQIRTFFAQWTRIGKQTSDKSAYYTQSDDGAVKIESVDQAALEEQLETGSTVQIDMSELKAEQVVLPAGAVSDVFALPKAEALSIKTPAAAVTLDKAAMQSVTEAAKGGSLRLRVRTGNELNPGQTAIIGDTEQSVVLDVGLTANGTEIHSFDGEVTVSVPFDWTKQGVLQAWYLADDGTKQPVEVVYRGGNAVLTLEHFSTYAIVVKSNGIDETVVSVNGNAVAVNAPAGAATCIAALYSADGRQMAVGKSEIAENMATVTWKSVDWTKVQTLKVFFLDGSGAPIKSSVKALIKVES